MTENEKVYVVEILDDVDRLLTEEDLEGGVTLGDLLLESAQEEIENRVIGYCKDDEEVTAETFIQIKRGKRYVSEDIRRIASGIGYFGKFGQSVADWDGDMYASDEPIDKALSRIYRGAMSTAESVNSIASAMENMSKSGHGVADWDGDMYGVSPMTGDSPTTMHLLFTDKTEEVVRPKKRGERCSFCSNMTKKELKKHDSCPSCGRSLFALKSRGW